MKTASTTLVKSIKLLVLDVDGVLTDGSLFYDNHGNEYKAFSSRDGLGLRMLQDNGTEVAILTGRKSTLVSHRADNLGINPDLVFQGYKDKRPAFEAILEKTGYAKEQIAYMGDDLIDLPVMTQVGLAIAVADAHPVVIEQADWVTQAVGGRGAVREVCEGLLSAQGKLDDLIKALIA